MRRRRITSLVLSVLLVGEQAMTFVHGHEGDEAPHVHFSCPWSHDDDSDPCSHDEEPAPDEPCDEHDGSATYVARHVIVECRPCHDELSLATPSFRTAMAVIERIGVEGHSFSFWPHAPPFGLHADRPIYLSLLSLLL